jgi:hypothetical protein
MDGDGLVENIGVPNMLRPFATPAADASEGRQQTPLSPACKNAQLAMDAEFGELAA